MSTMKALRYFPPGGPDKLKYQEEAVPKPGPGEVLIKVHATSLIADELNWPVYENAPDQWSSHIPGPDFAGTIIEGTGTGSKVFAFNTKRDHGGGMAEYAVISADHTLPAPKTLSFEEAASVPLSALTAWQALEKSKGKRLLIVGIAGATGVWMAQFAKLRGMQVWGTGSSEASRKIANDLGVTFVHKDDKLPEYDTALDCVGIGLKEGHVLSIVDFSHKNFFIVEWNAEQLKQITELIDTGKVRTILDRVVPFEKAKEAYFECAKGHNHGKVVVKII